MGRVAGSYGVRGWVKVIPEPGAQAVLAGAGQWWIGAKGYAVSGARAHGATVVAKLAGVDSPEQAQELKGTPVELDRAALPALEEGRYYLGDLIGLEVLNEQDERLGVVTRTYSNGVHDVVEVEGDRTRLIPWVAAVIKAVDLQAKQIRVDWGADW